MRDLLGKVARVHAMRSYLEASLNKELMENLKEKKVLRISVSSEHKTITSSTFTYTITFIQDTDGEHMDNLVLEIPLESAIDRTIIYGELRKAIFDILKIRTQKSCTHLYFGAICMWYILLYKIKTNLFIMYIKKVITVCLLSLISVIAVSAHAGIQPASYHVSGTSQNSRRIFTDQEIALIAKYLKSPTDYVLALVQKNGDVFVSALLGSAKVSAITEGPVSAIPLVKGVATVDVSVQKIQTCTNITRNIHRGDESLSTTKLQNFLVTRGLLNEKVSGFYGDKTIEAVKEYQGLVGIPVTGMVYDMTRQAIKAETCN